MCETHFCSLKSLYEKLYMEGTVARMKYKYFLFDLDGTLTDPKEGITGSVQYALKAFGIEETDIEKLTPFIGPPLRESFMKFYGFSEEQAEAAVAKYREWFVPKGIFQNRIYPGVKEMLKELKGEGAVLAVASSKPQVFVEKILRHFEIYDDFAVIVGSELNGKRESKEEVVEETLARLWGKVKTADGREAVKSAEAADRREMVGSAERADGTDTAKRKETVMIGDRRFDVEGGKAHGLVTVGVTFGYAQEGELESAGADYVVDCVEALRRLLMQ